MGCVMINGALLHIKSGVKLTQDDKDILAQFVEELRIEGDKDAKRKHGEKRFCRCTPCTEGKAKRKRK